jgi:hypothetical protein
MNEDGGKSPLPQMTLLVVDGVNAWWEFLQPFNLLP